MTAMFSVSSSLLFSSASCSKLFLIRKALVVTSVVDAATSVAPGAGLVGY